MVTELKLAATLQDFEVMNQEVSSLSEAMRGRSRDVGQKTEEFHRELAQSLDELETHYYASKWRHPPI